MQDPSARSSAHELIVPEASGSDWIDVDTHRVQESFIERGAVLFRGFDGDLDKFTAMTDRYCDGYMLNPLKGRGPVAPDRKIQTVNLSGEPFPLHGERCQTPFQADICWFYCKRAPSSGGETLFCDGALLAALLPEKVRRYLLSRGLRYRRLTSVEELLCFLNLEDAAQVNAELKARSLNHVFSWQDGLILKDYTVPALPPTRCSEQPAFCNFLFFSRYLLRRADYPCFEDMSRIPQELCDGIHEIARQISVAVEWQANDLLMIDNRRVMHGRNRIINLSERVIWSRFGYANF